MVFFFVQLVHAFAKNVESLVFRKELSQTLALISWEHTKGEIYKEVAISESQKVLVKVVVQVLQNAEEVFQIRQRLPKVNSVASKRNPSSLGFLEDVFKHHFVRNDVL